MAVNRFLIAGLVMCMLGCNYINYTPRSKRQKHLAKPSTALLDQIVDFRMKYNTWPSSKEEFVGRDPEYKESFARLPYHYTRFEVIDIDNMIFYFDQHTKDVDNYRSSEKVNLNTYRGEVKFYNYQGKIIWKTKMY